jgi:hypothetical protein
LKQNNCNETINTTLNGIAENMMMKKSSCDLCWLLVLAGGGGSCAAATLLLVVQLLLKISFLVFLGIINQIIG